MGALGNIAMAGIGGYLEGGGTIPFTGGKNIQDMQTALWEKSGEGYKKKKLMEWEKDYGGEETL